MLIIENFIIDESFLKESAPAIIYHSTYLSSAISTIVSNEFHLSSRFSSSSDNLGSSAKHFYLSTSTVKANGFRAGSNTDIVLVLDGNKINQRYKALPVDYWGPEWRRVILDPNAKLSSEDRFHSYETSDEQEIRVMSDKATIPNARNYIKEIHYLAPEVKEETKPELIKNTNVSYDQYFEAKTKIRDIANYDIPIYIYGNKKDFRILNKTKALFYKELVSTFDSLLSVLMKFADYPKWEEHKEEISKLERYGLEHYLHGSPYDIDDLALTLSADIHNTKGRDYSPSYIEALNKFSRLVKKYKSRDIRDFLTKFQAEHT